MNRRRLAWIGWALLAAFLIVPLLAACASGRYLTEEQDEEIARRCAEGCKVIPLPVWRHIEEQLQRSSSTRI